MNSPFFYILVAMTLLSGMISITFLLAWRTLGKKPYALSWAIAFLAATFQWTLTLMFDWFLEYGSFSLTINALALFVITLGLRGHCQRTGRSKLANAFAWAAIVVFLAVSWTTLVYPYVGISSALVPAFGALSLFVASRVVLQHRRNSRPAEIATAVWMILVGLAQLGAGFVTFMQGRMANEALQLLYTNVTFMTLPAGYTGMAILLLLMVASDLSEEMKELAIRDQLTGLLNRRGFGEQAAIAYSTARRSNRVVTLLMTDIDRFKQINDDFGHATGDLALQRFARLLQTGRRDEDIAARVGGEEFALVLPGADLVEALRLADELRDRIESQPLEVNGHHVAMTASFGVASISDKDASLADVMVRADRALYRSKREGRNRVDLESSQLLLAADGTLRPHTA